MTTSNQAPQSDSPSCVTDDSGLATGANGSVLHSYFDSPDAMLAIDAAGCIVAVSPATAALLGYREDELVGHSVSDLVVSTSAHALTTAERHVAANGTWDGELQLRRTDGVVVSAMARSTPFLESENGGNLLVFHLGSVGPVPLAGEAPALRAAGGFAADSHSALRESEERFRGAFDGAPIGMALISREGRFLQVNPALCDILGYSEADLLARTFPEVTAPVDRDSDRELLRELLANEIPTYQLEKNYVRQDGGIICGRLTVSLIRDAAGDPLYFVAQVQDITPYKAAGRALREAEARYRALVEQIPAIVYVDRLDSPIASDYVSPRIETLLGYSAEEWQTTPEWWLRYIHPDDRERILAELARVHATGEPIHLEYRLIARDGRTVWVQDEGELIRDDDGVPQYWQGFLVDITERKLAEEELRAAKEAAEEASRLKSAFLSMATHELRTPLTIISGYVELLAASSAKYTAEEREFLAITQTSISALTSLVNDLLDLARIEAGRMELEITAVDVAAAIERVRRMVAAQAAAKGIELAVEISPDATPVAADPDRLVQILLNLLGNALKFTETGEVRVIARAAGFGVEIAVSDTGIGIPPEVLPRIFDEFRQADAGTTRKFGGSGLGLAITRRLVTLQGGQISVESVVGVGTTFTVWLPAAAYRTVTSARQRAGRQPEAKPS